MAWALNGDHRLVVTLGTHGSGSTWIFNVVRKLIEAAGIPFGSLATESGLNILDADGTRSRFTVVKAHGLDLRFLRLVELANAWVITSVRDPRDSAVSQIERFDASLSDAVGDLSRALCSMERIASHPRTLRFAYEDRFMDSKGSIRRIARFLGLPARRRDVDAIFAALRPDAVRRLITSQPGIASGEVNQDPLTQWNRNHLGDGRIGKWQGRLSGDHAQAVDRALSPLLEQRWHGGAIHWSHALFRYDDDLPPDAPKRISCDGRERVLVFGPYLHLPGGRWQATLDVSADTDGCGGLSADVYLPMYDRIVADRAIDAAALAAGRVELTFDHHDHFESVELRIRAAHGSTGSLCFAGATLGWAGPV